MGCGRSSLDDLHYKVDVEACAKNMKLNFSSMDDEDLYDFKETIISSLRILNKQALTREAFSALDDMKAALDTLISKNYEIDEYVERFNKEQK